jgi:hypothetical protein
MFLALGSNAHDALAITYAQIHSLLKLFRPLLRTFVTLFSHSAGIYRLYNLELHVPNKVAVMKRVSGLR